MTKRKIINKNYKNLQNLSSEIQCFVFFVIFHSSLMFSFIVHIYLDENMNENLLSLECCSTNCVHDDDSQEYKYINNEKRFVFKFNTKISSIVFFTWFLFKLLTIFKHFYSTVSWCQRNMNFLCWSLSH